MFTFLKSKEKKLELIQESFQSALKENDWAAYSLNEVVGESKLLLQAKGLSLFTYEAFEKSKKLVLASSKQRVSLAHKDLEDGELEEEIIKAFFDNQIKIGIKKIEGVINPSEVDASELKGVEWLRVSLMQLKGGIKKSRSEKGLYPSAKFFSGTRSGSYEQRLIIFNLDIGLIFKGESLEVTVYDNKQGEVGSVAKPSLKASFHMRRAEAYNEVIGAYKELIFHS